MRVKKDPKVSIIIPTYNRVNVITRAIKSVLGQTYQNFELIVVDDGSNDNTGKKVKNFNDSRINYICHEENKGGSAARNTGIQVAKGEYIAFLDSDDEWLPQKIEKQVEILDKDEGIGAVFTDRKIMPSGRIKKIKLPKNKKKQLKKIYRKNFLGGCSVVMVRKRVFSKIGMFDINLPSSQDFDMWIRLLIYYNIEVLNEVLVIIHCPSSKRITKNIDAKERTLNILKNKYSKYLKTCFFCRKLSNLGYLYYCMGNKKIGRNKIIESLQLYPFYIKAWIYLVVSFINPKIFFRIRTIFKKHEVLE